MGAYEGGRTPKRKVGFVQDPGMHHKDRHLGRPRLLRQMVDVSGNVRIGAVRFERVELSLHKRSLRV